MNVNIEVGPRCAKHRGLEEKFLLGSQLASAEAVLTSLQDKESAKEAKLNHSNLNAEIVLQGA